MSDSILIVDDESGVLSALKRTLIDEPYIVHTATGGVDGLELLKNNAIKVVISDERMPEMAGSEFLTAVKKLFPDTVRMMLTGHASVEAAMKAVNSGEIYRFFSKPWDDVQLKLAIRSALEKYNLEDENRRLLKTVRKQATELQKIEQSHPGITSLEKDEEGNLVIPDFSGSDRDLSDILSEIASESDKEENRS